MWAAASRKNRTAQTVPPPCAAGMPALSAIPSPFSDPAGFFPSQARHAGQTGGHPRAAACCFFSAASQARRAGVTWARFPAAPAKFSFALCRGRACITYSANRCHNTTVAVENGRFSQPGFPLLFSPAFLFSLMPSLSPTLSSRRPRHTVPVFGPRRVFPRLRRGTPGKREDALAPQPTAAACCLIN